MKVWLPTARLAFPSLFKPTAVKPEDPKKYQGTFIIEGDQGKSIVTVQVGEKEDGSPIKKKMTIDAMLQLAAEAKWGEKATAVLKAIRLKDNLCVHSGEAKADYDGFDDTNFYISARSKTRPAVRDRDGSQLSEEDGRPYAGCYVNGIIDVWAQDDPKWGKRINAGLVGVQFVKDGDAFGGGARASDDDFEDLGVDEEELDADLV